MNSEELEKSLRSEFEGYLKDRIDDLRNGVSEFQKKVNEDFEAQKVQLEESFRELSEKIGSGVELEESFTESVTEHLKLARDEGARITANAIAEAEKLEVKEEPKGADYAALSAAIDDVSSKTSQSDILKALVSHASEFTPRGAFFIVKNEHLVGWRVFGREDHQDPKVVREVFFPVASDTALSEAVRTLSTINSTIEEGEDDVMYRNKLGFEGDSSLHAIPLVARGRGVAVLYADRGASGEAVDVDAIKALMKVAGLTVEVLASQPAPAKVEKESREAEASVEEGSVAENEVAEVDEFAPEAEISADDYVETSVETSDEYAPEPVAFASDTEFSPVPQPDTVETEAPINRPTGDLETHSVPLESTESDATTWTPEESSVEVDADSIPSLDSFSVDQDFDPEVSEPAEYTFETEDTPVVETDFSVESDSFEADVSDYSFEAPVAEEPVAESVESIPEIETFESEQFSTEVEAPSEQEVDISRFDTAPLESPIKDESEGASESEYDFSIPATDTPEVSEPAFVADASDASSAFDALEETVEPVAEETQQIETETVEEAAPEAETEAVEETPKVRSRFADRNLDLPIEVGEDERRFHNDARRFARLLVSEIKLYNEQKVKEGRDAGDLYERLREAIDRSREMYDKRVQAPVAAKFDYFNYELVNTLAEETRANWGQATPVR